jgi:DNA-binding beta-propeller fold protein YncE
MPGGKGKEESMRRLVGWGVLVSLVLMLAGAAWADNDFVVMREAARKFATLPDGVRFPEGIAANPETGEIYVGTFTFPPDTNKLLRFRKSGRLAAQREFGGTPLLGLAFNPLDGRLYIANAGALVGGMSKIQRIAANFGPGTPIEDVAIIPGIGPPANRTVGNPDGSEDTIIFGNNAPAPNALVFSSTGDLFISDSFQGAIFKILGADVCTTPCSVETIKHDGLLATAGLPPFGANGLALSSDEETLFIANTGDDRILRMELPSGPLVVFAESINGADGIAFDKVERLWVAANQADEIVALNSAGRVIAKLGDFLGIQKDGSARGLLFPASLVIVKDEIFVTDLALPLTTAVGDEPGEDVTRYTISRIHIPKP